MSDRGKEEEEGDASITGDLNSPAQPRTIRNKSTSPRGSPSSRGGDRGLAFPAIRRNLTESSSFRNKAGRTGQLSRQGSSRSKSPTPPGFTRSFTSRSSQPRTLPGGSVHDEKTAVNATAMMMQERAAKDAQIRKKVSKRRSDVSDDSKANTKMTDFSDQSNEGSYHRSPAAPASIRAGTSTRTRTRTQTRTSTDDAPAPTTQVIHASTKVPKCTSVPLTSAPLTSPSKLGREFDNDVLSDLPGSMTMTNLVRDSSLGFGGETTRKGSFPFRRTSSTSSVGSIANSFRNLFSGHREPSDASIETTDSSNLGSTFLADHNKKFRQGIDHSINIMNPQHAALGYGQEPDPGRLRSGKGRRGQKKRESFINIMFGGSHRTRVRKQSMVDVVLGPDLTKLKQEESNHEKDSMWSKTKEFLADRGACIIISLLIVTSVFMTVFLIVREQPSSSSTYVEPIHTPEPTVATDTPTTKPSQLEPAPTPGPRDDTTPNPTTATQTATNAAFSQVKSALPATTSGRGSPHSSIKSATQVKSQKVFSLFTNAPEDQSKNTTISPSEITIADPREQLEAQIRQYNLTDPQDLANPQSSASRAVQWLLGMEGPLEAIDIDKVEDEALAEKNHRKIIERYALAVFYYATHEEDKGKPRIAKGYHNESSSHSSVRRNLNKKRRSPSRETHGTNSVEEEEEEEGTEWMADEAICEWRGIRCSKDRVVTHLKQLRQDLLGTIPSEIKGLENLLELNLSHNKIYGSLPKALGRLTLLTFLAAPGNLLTGPLPSFLGNLVHLHEINLANNRLEGPITLHGLPDLRSLRLSRNKFTGPTPALTNCTKLELLELDNNELTSMLPFDALSQLENLETLRLGNNSITGTLSSSIKDFPNLAVLEIQNNSVGGPFPDAFDQHHALDKLDLSYNAFRGALPASLGVLTEMERLILNDNAFEGSIPALWFGLTNLETLALNRNNVSGSIPPILGEMLELRDLRLNNNVLTGSLPSELGKLGSLAKLHLQNNHLTGEIPPSFASLLDGPLEHLLLFHNNITGNTSSICGKDTSNLQEFATDCLSEVSCECCFDCY